MPKDKRFIATALGLFAILFWSTSVAFSRSLMEQLGVVTGACLVYAGGGAVGCLYIICRPKHLRKLAGLPWYYWAGCGSLFVATTVCFYLAVGLSSGRQQVVEVGLINYLWVSMTLALSVPILKKKAGPGLLLGIFIACAGVAVAALEAGPFSWHVFRESLRSNWLPYVIAFAGALAWSFYSNVNRRWAGESDAWPVPVFLLASGLVLLLLRAVRPETAHWTPGVILQLGYTLLFPTLLAYAFWDVAMRRGNMVLVVSLSYLIPLTSTLITCALLGVRFGPGLGLACAMVIAGAVVCKRSVAD